MSYRNQIIGSLKTLELVRNQLFTQVVNIAAEGEFKEVLNSFENGDSYEFEMEVFENSNDINIVKLMDICTKIEEVYASLHNLNAIKDVELISSIIDADTN